MRTLFFLITLFAFSLAFSQAYLEKQETPIINTIPNPGFEAGKGQWLISVSSTATIVSGSNALQGASSLRFDSTAASQTVATKSITVPKMLQGKLCQVEVSYYNNEPTNFYLLRAKNASGTVLASTQLSTVTSQAVARVNDFYCPTTTMTAEVISVSAAAAVDLDSFHLGSVKNITKPEVVSVLGYEPLAAITATSPLNITGGASNPVVGANNVGSGVTSGTQYTKVTVDGFGRVTSGTSITSNDLTDSGIVSGTYTKIAVNSKGIATSGTTLIESDIPSLQTTKITSGIFGVANGGTGVSVTTTGGLLIGSGTSTLINLPAGSNGDFLTVASGKPSWTASLPTTFTVSTTTATSSSNIALSATTGTWFYSGLSITLPASGVYNVHFRGAAVQTSSAGSSIMAGVWATSSTGGSGLISNSVGQIGLTVGTTSVSRVDTYGYSVSGSTTLYLQYQNVQFTGGATLSAAAIRCDIVICAMQAQKVAP